ncbi:hypothetical protein SAMN04490239_1489 [Rhodococcus koreensis]|uniref:Uncharacterized protein n=1 Tax=Rhodococcus koreensis TaxID=99653 RepID=A0A1H4LVG3_9NOCA|nr:hypothetical protein SAMN04490239_1489 [Rhodococcus koreensis]
MLSVIMELGEWGLPLPAGGAPMPPWTELELIGETMTPVTGDPLTTEASSRSIAPGPYEPAASVGSVRLFLKA